MGTDPHGGSRIVVMGRSLLPTATLVEKQQLMRWMQSAVKYYDRTTTGARSGSPSTPVHVDAQNAPFAGRKVTRRWEPMLAMDQEHAQADRK